MPRKSELDGAIEKVNAEIGELEKVRDRLTALKATPAAAPRKSHKRKASADDTPKGI